MKIYWLIDRQSGDVTLVDGDTVERLLEVELGYVEWCIRVDGVFENGGWKVCGGPAARRDKHAVWHCHTIGKKGQNPPA